jgi:hypothetical protein
MQGVREATVDQIAAVPGFGPGSAERLLAALGVPSQATPADISRVPSLNVPQDSTLE